MQYTAIAAAALVVFATNMAHAQPTGDAAAPDDKPPPTTAKTGQTAESVAAAPSPADAHGRSAEPDTDGEWIYWIPRAVLFPVRVVGEVIAFPIRLGLYAYEVYSLGPRVKGIFFNEEGTVGLYPTALIETGFGLNVGGRLILRRIIGDTGLTGRAGFGGRFNQIYSTSISTNDTFEHFELDLEGTFEIRPKDRFYGIGNGELSDEVPTAPVDPFGPDQIESRFRQEAIRVTAAAAYRVTPQLSLQASFAVADRVFENSSGAGAADQGIAQTFDTDALTGFADGSSTVYSELELSYDTRRAFNRWEGDSTPSTGWLGQVYAGVTRGFGDDSSSFIRYGFDVQRYVRLADAPRTLALRAYLEGVTGGYDDVSFYDLPQLGGPLLLRGYDQEQYRDRVAALTTAEYSFDAVEYLSGFVFADVGRVYSDIDDFDLSSLRMGFGGGIEAHTKGSFLGRLTLASSVDGGFFATFSFDPVYDVRARVERK